MSDYVLGTDGTELARLGVQHAAWREQARAIWARAGFGPGDVLLDAGCGPGYGTLDLAELVGPRGRVIGRDRSPGFLEALERAVRERGLAQVETSLGGLEGLDLPAGSLDGAYARWVLSWLERPDLALERIARALRPGAALALQEYLHWGALRLVPASEAFDRAVAACLASWPAAGATIDVAERLPALAAGAGLALEAFEPVARTGAVGSDVWRWIGGFFESYLPRLEERGQLAPADRAAFEEEWRARTAEGRSFCLAPLVVDALLRKPAGSAD